MSHAPVDRDLAALDDITTIFDRPTWTGKVLEIWRFMPIEDVKLIVAAGQSEWLQVARRGYAGQGFQQEDFIRMFQSMELRVMAWERKHAPVELTDA